MASLRGLFNFDIARRKRIRENVSTHVVGGLWVEWVEMRRDAMRGVSTGLIQF